MDLLNNIYQNQLDPDDYQMNLYITTRSYIRSHLGVELTDCQEQALQLMCKKSTETLVINKARRAGTTTLLAAYTQAVADETTLPIVVISPSRSINNHYQSIFMPQSPEVRFLTPSSYYHDLLNGPIKLLVVEEGAFLSNHDNNYMISPLRRLAEQVIISSTPHLTSDVNWFHQLGRIARDPTSKLDYYFMSRGPHNIPAEFRDMMSRESYLTEFCGWPIEPDRDWNYAHNYSGFSGVDVSPWKQQSNICTTIPKEINLKGFMNE